MGTILNFISVASAFVFGVGILYWIMDISIGKLKFLHSKSEWLGLQVKDIIFFSIAVFVVLQFTTLYKPY